MIKPEQIPEKALRALCASMGCEWVMQDKEDQIIICRHITAVINAWPGAQKDRVFLGVLLDGHDNRITRLCLPLPKDAAGA